MHLCLNKKIVFLGKNIECDTAQEICIQSSKNVVRGMGVNKTPNSLLRASKAAAGVEDIIGNFDKACHIHKSSNTHKHRDNKNDVLLALNDLRRLRPFTVVAGRSHKSFQDINVSPLTDLNRELVNQWLDHHKQMISIEL